jgi:hypothetical protein
MTQTSSQPWPALPYDAWRETCSTLHMWTQIVGKIKLELSPFLNEWWQVTLHQNSRGMTTGLIPWHGTTFQMDFDFIDHQLFINTSTGQVERIALEPRSVADFYHEILARLASIGIEVKINPMPTEVPDPVSCDVNHADCSYDAEYVNRWRRIQLQTELVMQHFRSPFVGKSSPIHFFWGSFDLNHTRFSGRKAPDMPGAPRFMQLAEDQENFSIGFWPGNPNYTGQTLGAPAFFAYIFPAPDGFAAATVKPAQAYYHAALGNFILRYDDVRHLPTPEDAILEFYQSVYEAAANLAGWNRGALERS